jgi:VCBS repeat-containing protein
VGVGNAGNKGGIGGAGGSGGRGNFAPTAIASVGAPDATGAVTGSLATSDADDDTLAFITKTAPLRGALQLNSTTGAFTYSPTSDARHAASADDASAADLTDNFTLAVTDGYGGTALVTVTVAITPTNAAPTADSPNIGEADTGTGAIEGQLLASDTDGDTTAVTAVTAPTHGALTLNQVTGAFTYTPDAPARHAASAEDAGADDLTDSFTLAVTDGHGGTTLVAVNVDISPTNIAPTADSPNIGEADTRTGAIDGQLVASDTDGDTLTYALGEGPASGAVTVDSATGAFTYIPDYEAAGDAETDNFVATVTDGHGGSVSVEVTVPITAKVASQGTLRTGTAGQDPGDLEITGFDPAWGLYVEVSMSNPPSGTTFDASTSSLLAALGVSDVYVFSDFFGFFGTQDQANIALRELLVSTGQGTGAFTISVYAYDYDLSAFYQQEITAEVVGGDGGSGGHDNIAPTAIADIGTPDETTGAIAGTLVASDDNGDTTAVAAVTTPTHGTLTVDPATGEFLYTPDASARHAASAEDAGADDLADTFTLAVTDGRGGTTLVPITVDISPTNTDPVALINTCERDCDGGGGLGSVTASDADGDTLTYAITIGPSSGSVSIDPDTGDFTYTPDSSASQAQVAAAEVAAVQVAVVQVAAVSEPGVLPTGALGTVTGNSVNTWEQYSFTFTPSTTGANFIGFAFRQDPAFWSFDNAQLFETGSTVDLFTNGGFSSGGAVTITTNEGSSTIQAPANWGVWYQDGEYPAAAGSWEDGIWIDGAVGTFDGIYQGVNLTAGTEYTIRFDVYGNDVANSDNIQLGVYGGTCQDSGGPGPSCSVPASSGFVTLALPDQTQDAGNPSPSWPADSFMVTITDGHGGYLEVPVIVTAC